MRSDLVPPAVRSLLRASVTVLHCARRCASPTLSRRPAIPLSRTPLTPGHRGLRHLQDRRDPRSSPPCRLQGARRLASLGVKRPKGRSMHDSHGGGQVRARMDEEVNDGDGRGRERDMVLLLLSEGSGFASLWSGSRSTKRVGQQTARSRHYITGTAESEGRVRSEQSIRFGDRRQE